MEAGRAHTLCLSPADPRQTSRQHSSLQKMMSTLSLVIPRPSTFSRDAPKMFKCPNRRSKRHPLEFPQEVFTFDAQKGMIEIRRPPPENQLRPERAGIFVSPGGRVTSLEFGKEEGRSGLPNRPIFLGNVWWSWTESNRRPLECHASSLLKSLDFG